MIKFNRLKGLSVLACFFSTCQLQAQNRIAPAYPLDSRKSYTKNDWIAWTATFAPEKEQFEALIQPLYIHALETPSRVPLNDFYDSETGIRENFKARSVVGGFYMKVLADKLHTN
ncbi:DUF1793 domain-containing protein [[Flexibacter] sp. ATCC 35208]|uniref:glutaminase domain-containing protein n=1 Tax=[Flexibacter] sp. ATCC 35208 TaxID=1936242 RepID=UPI0009F936DD|nr:DUF1793 domain-containing protein [[Flexibacter] sp. ATCC 35208]